MKTLTQVSNTMQTVLVERANQLAIETGFTQRDRVLTGSSYACGLIFGWQSDPQMSLAGLSQSVGNAGTPISRQGLNQRLDQKGATFLKALLKESLQVVIQAAPVSQSILNRFTSVDLVDSSIITLPNSLQEQWRGSGGSGAGAKEAAMKLNVRLDVRCGQLKTLDLSDGIVHDRQSIAHHQQVAIGSLQIEDLGYFKLDDFEKVGQQGAYWLMRWKQKTKIYSLEGEQYHLPTWLPQQGGERVDTEILLGAKKQLRCRLVAERVPEQVVEQRHERLRDIARKQQKAVSEDALVMAHWTLYVTNVPPKLLTTQEVFIMGRYRWQIELLFKLWKSDLGVDQWASQNPERILCEIYAKLIGAIVTHWLLLVACWHEPRRSLRQAIPTIRGLAWQFANSLHHPLLLNHTVRALLRALSCCRMDKSQQHPRAFQLLASFAA